MGSNLLVNSPQGTGIEYRLAVTIHSDKEHRPISITVGVPESLALILMATPVKNISLSISQKGGLVIDNARLLDFK